MKLRKLALVLHRYIGITVGILLIAICLTGSLLVFGNEIDRFLNPQLLQVVPQPERVSLQYVVNRVNSVYPNLKIESIDIPQNPTAVYRVWSESKDKQVVFIYVNPYNGSILGSRLKEKTLMNFLVELHINFLAGKIGSVVVGICGMLLLVLCVSGLVLWTGWQKFMQGFKIRWKAPSKLLNYDIHKVLGMLSVAFLLLIVSTGVAMSFFSQFEQAVYALTSTSLPVVPTKSNPAADRQTLPVDRILENANQALPVAQTIWVNIPADSTGLYRVGKRFSQDTSLSSASSDSQIYVDQYTGKVWRVNTAHKGPLATKIVYSLYPLHIGSYGGLGMRIIYVLVGLAPTGLFITGFVLWRHRQWSIARRQAAMKVTQKTKRYPEEDYFWVNEWPWF
ncbi:PepSY-associated TM helix domain-containing protein [Aerosakkonema funiforme]|uniref:PepSY-associated TM helix domain-containing protein n=1 Tax=Aerosakkonema funiforme TaxID=1246630 RepID=UPI0035BA5609